MTMTKKVFIKTFGCQMNEYDSDKMLDVLHAADGYETTHNVDEADLILFNTCSVREKAQEKVFSDLGRIKHLKAKGVQIGVGGCVASQEGDAIIQRAPYVDVVFGPQTLHRLPELLNQRTLQNRPQVDISFPEIEKFDHLPPARVEGSSAFVSIMEGCSKYCSYCVVPYTRGEEVSRPFEDVLVEVAGLADQGVKEVTLLGQNVNAYLGKMGGSTEIADFALLLEYVSEIPGIERIRYTTSHPNEFTPRLIAAYAELPKLVSHLHLPVQHGSDRILMAMKRGYTVLEYKSTVRKLRAIRPDLAMSHSDGVGRRASLRQRVTPTQIVRPTSAGDAEALEKRAVNGLGNHAGDVSPERGHLLDERARQVIHAGVSRQEQRLETRERTVHRGHRQLVAEVGLTPQALDDDRRLEARTDLDEQFIGESLGAHVG